MFELRITTPVTPVVLRTYELRITNSDGRLGRATHAAPTRPRGLKSAANTPNPAATGSQLQRGAGALIRLFNRLQPGFAYQQRDSSRADAHADARATSSRADARADAPTSSHAAPTRPRGLKSAADTPNPLQLAGQLQRVAGALVRLFNRLQPGFAYQQRDSSRADARTTSRASSRATSSRPRGLKSAANTPNPAATGSQLQQVTGTASSHPNSSS